MDSVIKEEGRIQGPGKIIGNSGLIFIIITDNLIIIMRGGSTPDRVNET